METDTAGSVQPLWPEALSDLPDDSPLKAKFRQYLQSMGFDGGMDDAESEDAPDYIRETAESVLGAMQKSEHNTKRGGPYTPLHIRWFLRKDFGEVLKEESDTYEFPLDRQDLTEHLRCRNKVCVLVTEDCDGPSIGHLLYEIRQNSIGLLSLGMNEEKRGRGVSEVLLARMISKLYRRVKLDDDIEKTHSTKEQDVA